MDKIKQNKNYRLLSFSFALFLCLSLIPAFSVSADSVGFSDQPIPVFSSPSLNEETFAASLPVGNRTTSNGYSITLAVGSFENDIYVFWVDTQLYFVSETIDSYYYYLQSLYSPSSGNTSYQSLSPSQTRTNTTSNDYSLYYNVYSPSSSYTSTVPTFSTLNDGLSAVRDYIDNGGSSTEQLRDVSFSLPQGNIAYVDVSGNSGISSEAYLSLYKTMSFWHDRGYTSQSEYVGYADSIPSSIDVTTGQFSGLSQFHWSGVPDYNIFGQAKNYQYLAGLNSSAHYLVIYNAVGNSATAGGDTLSVRVTQARSVRVIPLTTDYSNGTYSATGSDSDGIDYSYDDDSGTWSWSSGGTPSVGPSEGGKTVIDSGQLTINEWLQKIANDIGNFFSGAIGAVTTLIGYASDFIQSISGLYSWLPGPVYSVLISALIIAITIGVIKVFI